MTSVSSFTNRFLIFFLSVCTLYLAREFLIPLFIGGVFAMLFLPLCKWLEKKGLYRGLAACLCVLILLLIGAGIVALVGWQVSELMSDVDQLKKRAAEMLAQAQQYISAHIGLSVESQTAVLKDQQPPLASIVQDALGSLSYLITDTSLVLIYILFFLYYRDHMKNFMIRLVPVERRDEMKKVVYNVTRVSQEYLVGLSKIVICLWILYGIGFSIVGVKNAIFFAILCGLLEIVPYIGNIIGTSITILVSAVSGADVGVLLSIAATYGFVQLFQGWVLSPLIVGPQVKINSLFTIIALVAGGLIWGVAGIFLAIPILAMLKIICDHFEPLKPYGFLIGETEKEKAKPGFAKKVEKWFRRRKS
jgi:predicted PurR-regulated permease PerM